MEPLPPDDLYKERYLVEKKIGQGGFGKVFLVREKDGEKCYAAKCIKVRDSLSLKKSHLDLLCKGSRQEGEGEGQEGGGHVEEPQQ